jgi:phage terminase large subunit-like protein
MKDAIPSREAIDAELKWREEHQLLFFYPDTGDLRRDLYQRHLEFFRAGAKHTERCLLGGNRSGKTFAGAYEVACHATGLYPSWWEGRRFDKPVSIFAAGKDARTVRDILQEALLGKAPYGLGMLPADVILNTTAQQGTPEAVQTIYIKHVSGGRSDIAFKSFDAGPESFYGVQKSIIWLDEEPPLSVYSECLLRVMSVTPGEPNGLILLTETPLLGPTNLVRQFMEAPEGGPKKLIFVGWQDSPHLSEEAQSELRKSILPHEVEARTQGRPMLGSGAVYPISESEITVPDFEIPEHWPRGAGMDVGFIGDTFCIWGAHDRDNDVVYLTGEYARAMAEPAVHVAAIRARGNYIPIFIDPASNASSQIDGRKLFEIYRSSGLNVQMADNGRDAGFYAVWLRLSTGRLKIFRSCRRWIDDFRVFARDENGQITQEAKFHSQAATRYLLLNTLNSWRPAKPKEQTPVIEYRYPGEDNLRWMQ